MTVQTIESLKRSINSAQDLAGVVRTMKTMAAVSIRQYETAVLSLASYSQTVETGLQMVMREHQPQNTLHHRHAGTTGAIIFGSDQGMCGQFNEQIAQFAIEHLQSETLMANGVAPVLCVGHRIADGISTAGMDVTQTFQLPGSAVGITALVQDLLPAIDEWRQHHDIAHIVVFHNRRLSASSWRPHLFQLLPLSPEQFKRNAEPSTSKETRCLPFWTMDTSTLFSRLMRQFLFVSLFRACAESLAGENASRISAMQAAEKNIRDRLQILRSEYAQRRQTNITEELLDVVTGFEALKDSDGKQ